MFLAKSLSFPLLCSISFVPFQFYLVPSSQILHLIVDSVSHGTQTILNVSLFKSSLLCEQCLLGSLLTLRRPDGCFWKLSFSTSLWPLGSWDVTIIQMCIYRLLWSVFTLQREKMQHKLVDIVHIAIKKTNHRRLSSGLWFVRRRSSGLAVVTKEMHLLS